MPDLPTGPRRPPSGAFGRSGRPPGKPPSSPSTRHPDLAARRQSGSAPGKPSSGAAAKQAAASKIPLGNKTDLSKKGKVANVAKQAAAGAAGQNTAGKLAAGQLTGAIAGAAQGVLEVMPKGSKVG